MDFASLPNITLTPHIKARRSAERGLAQRMSPDWQWASLFRVSLDGAYAPSCLQGRPELGNRGDGRPHSNGPDVPMWPSWIEAAQSFGQSSSDGLVQAL